MPELPHLLAPEARTLLLRISRGVPRLANHLLHLALFIADDRDRNEHHRRGGHHRRRP